jgi:hypothetical protein
MSTPTPCWACGLPSPSSHAQCRVCFPSLPRRTDISVPWNNTRPQHIPTMASTDLGNLYKRNNYKVALVDKKLDRISHICTGEAIPDEQVPILTLLPCNSLTNTPGISLSGPEGEYATMSYETWKECGCVSRNLRVSLCKSSSVRKHVRERNSCRGCEVAAWASVDYEWAMKDMGIAQGSARMVMRGN